MHGLKFLVVALSVAWASGMAHSADPEAVPAPRQPAADRPALDASAAQLGYALGLRIGGRIAADFKEQHPDVDAGGLARGLADAVRGVKPALDERQIAELLETFDARIREREKEFAKRMQAAATTNLAKAREFLAANAKKQGVVTLPSGLQYEVLATGSGPQPTLDDTVSTHYRGTHLDGTEFDGTDPQEDPATFPIRGVVPGWQEALPLMKVGSKWKLYVPPHLGYGAEGSPPVIEPNEVLVFEIDLLRIVPRP